MAAKPPLNVMNIDGFLAGLDKAAEHLVAAVRQGLIEFAEQLLGNAQDKCPVDTGALKASATRGEIVQQAVDRMLIEVGFNLIYAAAVHEVLTSKLGNPVRHPQGQAKLLEAAMRELAPKLLPYLEKKLAAAAAAGGQSAVGGGQ